MSDRLSRMRSFVRVVDRRGFSPVARELGLHQASVSRQVAALEKELGLRLITRSTRHFQVTDAGQQYYQVCRELLQRLDATETRLRETQQGLDGRVRIALPTGLGRRWLGQQLLALQAANPRLQLELVVTDLPVDLVEHGLDFVVRAGSIRPGDFVVRTLGRLQRGLFASPDHLRRHGTPCDVEALTAHRWIIFTPYRRPRQLKLDTPEGGRHVIDIDGPVVVDDAELVREALLAGAGLFPAPLWLVHDLLDGAGLVRVLPAIAPPPRPLSLVYRQARMMSRRAREAMAALVELFPQLPGALPEAGPARGRRAR